MYNELNIIPPITNACGILSYPDVFWRLEKMGARPGAWVIKSIGPREKKGNENPTVLVGENWLANSFALPCASQDSIENELNGFDLKTPLIGSVYGSNERDYCSTVSRFDRYFVAWELNISCPNAEPEECSVRNEMSDIRKVKNLVSLVKNETDKPIIVKLSPNEAYVTIAQEIADEADYICCGNTYGPGLFIEPISGKKILAGSFGGISGGAVRAMTMKMVYDVYNSINGKSGIIAAGGISKAEHIISYARAGANVFQIGTAFRNKDSHESVELINGIWKDTLFLLDEIGAENLNELIGENYV